MADTYYQRAANRIRMEMDRRSPRLRLSIIGYLLDAGQEPDLEVVDELVKYVSSETEDYACTVEGIQDPEEDNIDQGETKNAYEIVDGGNYL